MNASVIIASYMRQNLVRALLKALLRDLPDMSEILVVVQGVGNIDISDPRLRIIRRSRPNLPAARNAGIEYSRGDIVLFLDDDVVPMPDLVRQHEALHTERPDISVIAGRVRDANNRGSEDAVIRLNRKNLVYKADFGLDTEEDVESMCGAHMSFKRRVFDTVRFDPWFVGNAHFEEVDLALRLRKRQGRILFSSRVSVDHILQDTGGCRSESSRPLFHRNHFRNASLCFAKNCSLRDVHHFLQKQKHDLEYFARRRGGHDPAVVLAGVRGIFAGLILGSVRRCCGAKRFR
jgi:GT2 family glycosyltransferase